GGGPDAAEQGSGPATDGPIEGDVSFAHWRAEDQAVFADLIDAFTAEHGEVSIAQEISPSNDYQTTALQRIRGGNIGDLFVAFRGAQFVDMVSAGLYADLTDTDVLDKYTPDLITAGEQDGVQYGLPYQFVFNQPITNQDLLESVGVTEPPTDWDGWLAMCEAVLSA